MKVLCRILPLVILLIATTATAQAPGSFRNIATGGTINDNLDLSHDPIELRFIEGFHFFSNLTNLTSTNERLLDDINDDEFLLGVSLLNPWVGNLWNAFGMRMRNTENSNWINIDPDLGYGWMPSENGWGLLSYDYSAFLDTNWDGVYDQEQSIFQEVTDYDTFDDYRVFLNNTYLNSMGTFGARFFREKDVTSSDRSSAGTLGTGWGSLSQYFAGAPTFETDVAIHDIGGDYDTNLWSEDGDFETTNTNTLTVFDFAYMTNWKKYEVRGDCGIMMGSDLWEGDDRYHGEETYNDPLISGYNDTYFETQTYKEKQNEEGTDFLFGGSIRKTFQKGKSRIYDGFWQVGANMRMGGYDYVASEDFQHTGEEDYFDGDGIGWTDFTQDISESELVSDKGSADELGFGFWGNYNRQLGNNLTFGFGAGWNRSSTTLTADYICDYERVTEMDYYDNTFVDDYVQTETETFAADHTWEQTVSTFTCPVGLEYRTGKRGQWAWRCGSRFTRTSTVTIDELDAIDDDCTPYTTVIDYDGATPDVETIGDNIYGSTIEEIHNTFSNVTFNYGIGYTPVDYLQIDFICVFDGGFDLIDSDFFKDLRISITLNH